MISRRNLIGAFTILGASTVLGADWCGPSNIPNFPNYMTITVPATDNLRKIWPRVRGSERMLESLPGITLRQKVEALNVKVNHSIKYVLETNWQSPEETIKLGSGDCKDYATLKYAYLRGELGFKEEDLAIVIGMIRGFTPVAHAFCTCRIDDQWWVLDLRFNQLIRPQDYINWTPLQACSGEEIVLYSHIMELKDVAR